MSEILKKAAGYLRRAADALNKVAEGVEAQAALPFEERNEKTLEILVEGLEVGENPFDALEAMAVAIEKEFPRPVKPEDIALL